MEGILLSAVVGECRVSYWSWGCLSPLWGLNLKVSPDNNSLVSQWLEPLVQFWVVHGLIPCEVIQTHSLITITMCHGIWM